ncbi:hypothetical protein BWR18_05695 [Tateyamaria omphalii]|uniref:Uncharacterized protein n=1 Tax=Tateyamaria omphalii TaxID=299262 RepID=A0A1P8MT26_9RHOB|nr:hypothetical protein BWR18_05695 [Tateyamaria omphalii]
MRIIGPDTTGVGASTTTVVLDVVVVLVVDVGDFAAVLVVVDVARGLRVLVPVVLVVDFVVRVAIFGLMSLDCLALTLT